MIVYVLLGRTHYEGDTLLGVYASQDDAAAAYDGFLEDVGIQFDEVIIQAVTVGAAADMDLASWSIPRV